ncbi:MAG: DUF3466 family protein [Psychromonas sp.]|nr:DUF3466 family protein [Psychromonas sp.]
MKFKITLHIAALMLVCNAYGADLDAYYSISDIHKSVVSTGAHFGPYLSAMSDNGRVIATYSFKSALNSNVDLALPYTFNRPCQYANEICGFEFYGSDNPKLPSYQNGYQKWRNDIVKNIYSQHLFSRIFNGAVPKVLPSEIPQNADIKITDVKDDGSYTGFFSSLNNKKIRIAFYVNASGLYAVLSSKPNGDDNFNSAYAIHEVNGKTYVIGSVSSKINSYFNECYSGDLSNEGTKGQLTYCPGYDTEAYFWDVTDLTAITSGVLGTPLSSKSGSVNASALAINDQGLAVGVSSKYVQNGSVVGDPYNPQRAIFMNLKDPSKNNIPAAIELTSAMDGISEKSDIYNTWPVSISSAIDPTDPNSLVWIVGNRQFAVAKERNEPTEFFITDSKNTSASFPLENKVVLTTKRKQENKSPHKIGANSRAYDAAMIADGKGVKSLWVVGQADDYDQINPVTNGAQRGQTAFIYEKNTDKSWRIDDLICSKKNGVVTCPLIRVRSARVINSAGTILAEGEVYPTVEAFQYMYGAKDVVLKLTRNPSVLNPDNSPNAWDSALYQTEDVPYKRHGAAAFWLVLLSLPVLLIRRLNK